MLAARSVQRLEGIAPRHGEWNAIRRTTLAAWVPQLGQLLPEVCGDAAHECVVCVGLNALCLLIDAKRVPASERARSELAMAATFLVSFLILLLQFRAR